jgi:hypothetical protein
VVFGIIVNIIQHQHAGCVAWYDLVLPLLPGCLYYSGHGPIIFTGLEAPT